ncbi:MAG TPA: asparaginase [Pseudonocardiaceae bacterium]|nr:asparaginase [Pseudonocardiaceae bacterium]
MHEVVATVWRNDVAESVHHGSVVGLAADGSIAFTVGQPHALMFPRSSAKPLQGIGMVRNGLGLSDELLALACASHPGEAFHIEGVRRILAGAGLSPDDLQCTPGLPMDEHSRLALGADAKPAPVYMNCSGKHAGMLATCVSNGWSTASYREPAHPLQVAIRDTVAALAGEPVGAVGVDGCGAPLFGISLLGLARAFRQVALGPAGSPEDTVRVAMNTYPEWVGGTGREVARLMRALPGSVAKDGAEGVHAIGLPDGRAVAMKIADGAARARSVVMVAALRRLGVTAPGLAGLADVPVLGHGEPVGAILPTDVVTGPGVAPGWTDQAMGS